MNHTTCLLVALAAWSREDITGKSSRQRQLIGKQSSTGVLARSDPCRATVVDAGVGLPKQVSAVKKIR